jgi:hypothetical protein
MNVTTGNYSVSWIAYRQFAGTTTAAIIATIIGALTTTPHLTEETTHN